MPRTGEEFGFLGSRHWVENHADKLDEVSNMFNHDGGPTVASSLSITAAMMNGLVKVCEPLNDINPDFPLQ